MPKPLTSPFRAGRTLTALAAAALWSPAALAASVSASASAEVLEPIAVTVTRGLHFGTLSAGSAGGSVTLALSGERSASGDVSVAAGQSGQVAQIVVTGAPDAPCSLSLPESIVLTDESGHRMHVSSFTSDAPDLLTNGRVEVAIGAALSVEPNQPVGAYAGTFSVTVDYN